MGGRATAITGSGVIALGIGDAEQRSREEGGGDTNDIFVGFGKNVRDVIPGPGAEPTPVLEEVVHEGLRRG